MQFIGLVYLFVYITNCLYCKILKFKGNQYDHITKYQKYYSHFL